MVTAITPQGAVLVLSGNTTRFPGLNIMKTLLGIQHKVNIRDLQSKNPRPKP